MNTLLEKIVVVDNPPQYVIDWEKVQTLNDVKRLLKAIDFSFSPNYKHLEEIKDLVRIEKEMNYKFTPEQLEIGIQT